MDAFYFIDKPFKLSSFDVIRQLRKILNTKKIGHTGTLDPLATGGLVLAVGNYTKLIPYLEKDTKEYEFEIMLDGVTESYDLAEKVKYISVKEQEKYKKELTEKLIKSILKEKFSGKIKQVPPKYSALKINGQKAYDLARQGKQVDIKSREVNIFNIEIIDYDYPKLLLKAKVSSGTYIRSIASDLGEILGSGGYISRLRRTKIGNLDIKDSQSLDAFDQSKPLDIKKLFANKEFVTLEESFFEKKQKLIDKLNNGLKVIGNFDYKIGEDLFVFYGNKITNIIEYDGEKLVPKRKI